MLSQEVPPAVGPRTGGLSRPAWSVRPAPACEVGLAGAAAMVLAEGVWLVAGLREAATVSNVGGVTVAAVATACCVAAGRHTARLRPFWALMTVNLGLATAGQVAWAAHRFIEGPDALPTTPLIGAIFVAGSITGTGALLSCCFMPRSLVVRGRILLDGVIVGLSLAPVGWMLAFRDLAGVPLTGPVGTLGLLFPMLSVMQLTVLIAVGGPVRSRWPAVVLVGAGLAVQVVAGTVSVSLVATGGYVAGLPVDVCWPLSYLLVALATRYPPAAQTEDTQGIEASPVPWWRVALPYLPVGGAIVAVIVANAASGRTPPLIFVTVVGLLATLAVRQGLAAYENSWLAQRLRHLAYRDPLTGLPNRLLFTRRLRRAIRDERRVAVLLLDLDGFKQVNDRFGHAAGDALLSQVAERMSAVVGGDGVLARVGGDEFAVLVDLDGHGRPEGMAERLLRAAGASAREEEAGVHPSASIGIAEYGAHHAGHADLLRDADIAMYAAKAAGKSAYRFCTPRLREAAVTRAELIADLRRALDEGEQLELEFQPIVELATGLIRGAEALVRWRHPRRGLLPPDRFLPLAEESGLIVPVDRWVIGEACRAAASWQDIAPGATVAVNLAPAHLRRADVTATVADAAAAAGLKPQALTLELTETALIESTATVLDRLHLLREIGVELAIDDFGTGYSSLSYLHRIPATELKIDKSFVARLGGSDERAYATVDMVSKLATAFDLVVVAEGVETDSQHRAVAAIGCPQGQGFRYGRPGSLEDLRGALRAS